MPTHTNTQSKELGRFKDALEPNPTTEIYQNALSEFTAPCIASMAFLTLFPDGVEDPKNWSTITSISDNDLETLATKVKHLVKLAEKIQGKWHYRFASNPRFGNWDLIYFTGNGFLSQGNFCMKQPFGDLPLTIDELREMLENKSYSEMMSKMQYYAKQISGTNSYWYQTMEQLKTTLNQLAPPTIF